MIAIVLIFCTSAAHSSETKEQFNVPLRENLINEDWPKVLEDANLGLEAFPKDEAYLKIKANAYWNMDKFDDAIEAYERLIDIYPAPRYKANLEELKIYKTEYEHALRSIENVDSNNWDMKDVIPLYFNVVYMQQKINKSYQLIKKFWLQDAALVHTKAEDLFLLDNDGPDNEERHKSAQEFDNSPVLVKLKQANVFQAQGKIVEAKALYEEVLALEPQNISAQMGMGYLKLNERDFLGAREIFEKIYEEQPDCVDAKIAVSNSYFADARYLSALEVLDGLPDTGKTEYLRALIYQENSMFSSAYVAIDADDAVRSDDLRYGLKKRTAPWLTPRYSFFNQTLADRFKLNSHKMGFSLQEGLGKNIFGLFSYTGIHFRSGNIDGTVFGTNANEVDFAFFGRPRRRLELQANIGGRFFRTGTGGTPSGAMLVTDSWLKYYFSDMLDAQIGFSRFNHEESFLSAAGAFVAPGVFAGRVSDNRLYLNINQRLPKRSYVYFKGALGLRKGENLPTNPYADGLLGIGKVVYDNRENPFFNIVAIDLATYNAGYKHNVLDEFGTDSLFGVYYSPPYFNASSLNVRAEGYNHNMKLRWGVKAFVASQIAPHAGTTTRIGVCFVPYIYWEPNERLTFNAVFHYSNFADVQKYYAMFQLQIKLFRRK